MTTRFYLHSASSSVSGTLPSAQVSTMALTAQFDAFSVNRSMDTTISAGSQVDLTATKTNSSSTALMYMTRFLSSRINQTSISANTWTLNIACWANSSSPFYPSNTSHFVPSCLYVWRPSTGAVVGSAIFDGVSSTSTLQLGSTSERVSKVNFTGSAVTIQSGDILVLEAWTASNVTSSQTWHYAYDGATINTSDNTSATNHAAYIETPENITFTPPSIDATATTISNLTNKFITII